MRPLTLILLLFIFTASTLNDARRANEAYERGNYAEAVQLYRQAIAQDPDNARLHFNLGNALYQMGDLDEAKEAFSQSRTLSESPRDQSFADYNTGRMMLDEEQYDEAISYFREALKNNPNDLDTKHNYELAIRQQQEQEEQEQDQSDPDSNGDDDEQQDEQQQQDSQQDQEQEQQPDMDQQPDMPQDQGEDQEQEQQPQPFDMSPEEAQNILDALEQLERELLENRKKESSEPQSRNEKDW